MISDGVYKTKKELIESLEDLKLETVCKIVSGAFDELLNCQLKTKNNESKHRKKHTRG